MFIKANDIIIYFLNVIICLEFFMNNYSYILQKILLTECSVYLLNPLDFFSSFFGGVSLVVLQDLGLIQEILSQPARRTTKKPKDAMLLRLYVREHQSHTQWN